MRFLQHPGTLVTSCCRRLKKYTTGQPEESGAHLEPFYVTISESYLLKMLSYTTCASLN